MFSLPGGIVYLPLLNVHSYSLQKGFFWDIISVSFVLKHMHMTFSLGDLSSFKAETISLMYLYSTISRNSRVQKIAYIRP